MFRIHLSLVLAALLLASPAGALELQDTHIKVQVKGAVKRPGMYSLLVGSRVAELIAHAGGPSKDADLRDLNLAQVLSDGEACRVPTHAELATPKPVQLAAAPRRRKGRSPKATKGTALKLAKAAGMHVHLNQATVAQLETLPGVGEGLATSILRERQKLGRFHSLDELREVAGFGQKRLERVRPFVAVD